jgi:hypothetical protein
MTQEYGWDTFLAIIAILLFLTGTVVTQLAGEEFSDLFYWIVGGSGLSIIVLAYVWMVTKGWKEPYLWTEGNDHEYFRELRMVQHRSEGGRKGRR